MPHNHLRSRTGIGHNDAVLSAGSWPAQLSLNLLAFMAAHRGRAHSEQARAVVLPVRAVHDSDDAIGLCVTTPPTSNDTMDRIGAGRIIAIMRGDFAGRDAEIVAALSEAGIVAVEVTMNSPRAVRTIERLARDFEGRVAIGAGTVLRSEEVEQLAFAGAQFVVSPNRDTRVIETTKRLGLVSLPGCFTPSEIVEAIDAGADAPKLFPANVLGPAFVKALVNGPLPGVRLVPTGGVDVEAARRFITCGAWAVGVGSDLVSPDDATMPGGLERLHVRARLFVAAVARTGGARP